MMNLFKIKIDQNRIFGLDILRAVAILSVVIGHASYLIPQRHRSTHNFILLDGVSLFFVLSGFLIGGILIKSIHKKGLTSTSLKEFWIRRWFRTLPNYFLILAILCLLELIFSENFNIRSVNRFFYFSQNIYQQHPHFFPEAWSLAVEEWFYLIFPIVTFLLFRVTKSANKSIFITAIIFIIITHFFRYYRWQQGYINSIEMWDLNMRKQVITRLDSLMFGVLGAYIYFYFETTWIKKKNLLLGVGIIMILFQKFFIPKWANTNGLFFSVFSFSFTSLYTLFLLPFLSQIKTHSGIIFNAITYLSLISYSMYLLNLSIIQFWILNYISFNTNNGYINIISNYATYYILLIPMSILLYKYFEVPMTALREKFK